MEDRTRTQSLILFRKLKRNAEAAGNLAKAENAARQIERLESMGICDSCGEWDIEQEPCPNCGEVFDRYG